MGNRKGRQQQSKVPPLKRGCCIILRKGEASKVEYNGLTASVLEYPSKGSWMTVALQNSVLKWRKSHYLARPSIDRFQGVKQPMLLNEGERLRQKHWFHTGDGSAHQPYFFHQMDMIDRHGGLANLPEHYDEDDVVVTEVQSPEEVLNLRLLRAEKQDEIINLE